MTFENDSYRQRLPNTAYTYLPLKRILDIYIAALALLFLWPILALTAMIIYIDSPGPVIFRQVRAGRFHQPFVIYKFRTMRLDAPQLSTEEMQASGLNTLTRTGTWLRRTSLDELPQLVNVLKGDMSLIGPRPALMTQVPVLRGREQSLAFFLRPGITGYAQVTGRDDLSDSEKIERDRYYIDHLGPKLDALILWHTLIAVFKGTGTK